MAPSLAFVASLVVARDPGHRLLLITRRNVLEELRSARTAKNRGLAAVMLDDDVA